ncbi:Uncharacterized protein APZ42_027237 [Daphnia magna]|uniref:Uncharacterized protein n=1 Tax=Daphnia magna TaxID=35525 RepID=A0A164RDA5_9CRUS|nr:Uncharacterized protein APZ42_027237 [Daphnia magna]
MKPYCNKANSFPFSWSFQYIAKRRETIVLFGCSCRIIRILQNFYFGPDVR